jgi:protoporphyrinogen oxidase
MAGTVVLGAGPAGLAAALQIARRRLGPVTVIEQQAGPGGNAGSFLLDGIHVDFGSHRLHPACDPSILRDLQELMGSDLLLRPRHGRIRLRSRWIHFPLRPLDLALRLPPAFAVGAAADMVLKAFAPRPVEETFASVLERGLGRTLCRSFYFPYARKIWGASPEELSAIQARRRVSAGSSWKMVMKVLAALRPKSPTAGRFYYPRQGYGQICESIAGAVDAAGGRLIYGARVTAVERHGPRWRLRFEGNAGASSVEADRVWSTLPLNVLARLVSPAAPAATLAAAGRMRFRAMVLVYLILETQQFTPFDAHYFPDDSMPLARLSEPKNYSASEEPRGLTVLCGEVPCDIDSELWRASDQALGEAMRGWLASCGLPVTCPVRRVVTRRLPHAYPLYLRGYEETFRELDEWASSLDGLLTFGRQGLFAHDNLHHALLMGYSAAECLDPAGRFDGARWSEFRRVFAGHVVED